MVLKQIFTDKIVTTLKNTLLSASPVHDILLNLSLENTQWIINNGYTLIEFGPVCCSENEVKKKGGGEGDESLVYGITSSTTAWQERGVQVSGDSERRDKPIWVFREAMKVLVKLLQGCELEEFVVKTSQWYGENAFCY